MAGLRQLRLLLCTIHEQACHGPAAMYNPETHGHHISTIADPCLVVAGRKASKDQSRALHSAVALSSTISAAVTRPVLQPIVITLPQL